MGSEEISTLFPRKITPAVPKRDVFNIECMKQYSSYGVWGLVREGELESVGRLVLPLRTQGGKNGRKANQMKSLYFRRSKK